jgi:ribosomal protein L37E
VLATEGGVIGPVSGRGVFDTATNGELHTSVLGKQSLLTPRFCRRCGGSLVRTATGHRCVECGTERTVRISTRDFIIVRPSQSLEQQLQQAPLVLPTPWRRRRSVRRTTQAITRPLAAAAAIAVRGAGHAVAAVLRAAWHSSDSIDRASWHATQAVARAIRQSADALLGATSVIGRRAYPRMATYGRAAFRWSREEVGLLGDSLREVSLPRLDVISMLPPAGSAAIPIAILIVAILIAAGLGGVLAAALTSGG